MAVALEVRSPFLDTSLVEYVNSLPHDLKLRGGVTKYLFKESLRCGDGQGPIVPREIIDRRKKGFGIPVARWIRREQAAAFREALTDAWPGSLLPMFDRAAVRQLRQGRARDWALERLTTIGQACTAVLRQTLSQTISWVIERVEEGWECNRIKAHLALA